MKKDKETNQNLIDTLYSDACKQSVTVTNSKGMAQTSVNERVALFCQRLTANAGDKLIDMDLSKAIIWNVATFTDGKSLEVNQEESILRQQGFSQNDGLVKILESDKTRCWQPESDCSPPSAVLKKTGFMEKFGTVM